MMVHFSISCCSLVFDGKSESEHLMVYCRLFYILGILWSNTGRSKLDPPGCQLLRGRRLRVRPGGPRGRRCLGSWAGLLELEGVLRVPLRGVGACLGLGPEGLGFQGFRV